MSLERDEVHGPAAVVNLHRIPAAQADRGMTSPGEVGTGVAAAVFRSKGPWYPQPPTGIQPQTWFGNCLCGSRYVRNFGFVRKRNACYRVLRYGNRFSFPDSVDCGLWLVHV
jgi:hypothetical protein